MREPEDYLEAPQRCVRCGTPLQCNCRTDPWAERSTAQREAAMSEEQKARRAAWVAGR